MGDIRSSRTIMTYTTTIVPYMPGTRALANSKILYDQVIVRMDYSLEIEIFVNVRINSAASLLTRLPAFRR